MKDPFPSLLAVIRDHLGLNLAGISRRVARKIYLGGASVRNCDGRCCRKGATVSVEERDRILAHAGIVREAMTSRARRISSRWFTGRIVRDADFTAGRTTDTRVVDGACVFYRTDGLCALQVASGRHLSGPYVLKPTICLLWPLCVQDRRLDVGYAWFTRRRECCAPVRSGRRTILKVIVPDRKLFEQMSRPGTSRGGGPPEAALGESGGRP